MSLCAQGPRQERFFYKAQMAWNLPQREAKGRGKREEREIKTSVLNVLNRLL